MAHPSWKGTIQLSLVSVPVQAYTAANTAKGDVSFNQLHDKCKSRVKYVKTCRRATAQLAKAQSLAMLFVR